MIKVAVTGAAGRMGRAIIAAIEANTRTELTGALEREDSAYLGKDAGETAGTGRNGVRITESAERAFRKSDVVIDFSTPEATMKILETIGPKAMVIGTTGFSHAQRDRIKELSVNSKIVIAPNMSIGVNLLLKLVHEAARVVGREYDMEIVEAHHRLKKDAPSGTALKIAEVAAAAVERDLEKVAVYERKGIIGERRPEEIGIQTIRAGDIVGDHTIIFAGPGERIELTHKASSRDTFAAGAVRAAVWVMERPNGLYDMQDVLGLKD